MGFFSSLLNKKVADANSVRDDLIMTEGFTIDPSYFYDLVQLEFELECAKSQDDSTSESKKIESEDCDSGLVQDKTTDLIDDDFDSLILSAENGSEYSQYKLGLIYSSDARNNTQESFKWFLKSAKQGYPKAEFSIALCYTFGIGCDVDHNEAFYWLLKAAENNHSEAQYFVAQSYCDGYYGTEGKVDNKKGFEWLYKSAIAGSSGAQNDLGYKLLHGEGVEVDVNEAKYWFEKSANQGDPNAQLNLGSMFSGVYEGFSADKDKAIAWYRKAADQGENYAFYALYTINYMDLEYEWNKKYSETDASLVDQSEVENFVYLITDLISQVDTFVKNNIEYLEDIENDFPGPLEENDFPDLLEGFSAFETLGLRYIENIKNDNAIKKQIHDAVDQALLTHDENLVDTAKRVLKIVKSKNTVDKSS
jgi:TPR repeat protein